MVLGSGLMVGSGKMKSLLMMILLSLQMIVIPAAPAWSPLDSVESAVKSMSRCYGPVASDAADSEVTTPTESEDDEEEPECD